jgi:diguanylate cyclase (GGDEF)-like protein
MTGRVRAAPGLHRVSAGEPKGTAMTKGAAEAEKASVLVVDDTPDNIEVLTGLLKDHYRVRAAVDGPTALALARRFHPDIILLDVMMPGMDGYQVCRALRSDPYTEHIPVIFITALNEEESEKRGLDLGAVDYITKPFSPPLVLARVRNHLALQSRRRALEQEVQVRTKELAQANTALANEVVARMKAMERAEYLFNYDALTGLPNRHQFIERLDRLIKRAKEDGDSLALVGLSLDRFNVVKTTLGGAVSDQLLIQTGRRLLQAMHASDPVGRIGGEEFATVISLRRRPEGQPLEDAATLSSRLQSLLARPFELSSGNADVHASAAYALFPEDADTGSELMRRMETALEHVKITGNARVERFDESMASAVGATAIMEMRIREALKEGAFVPHYQPKVAAVSGRVLGAEALIRWPMQGGTYISPSRFIPIAERCNLISAIDRYMLEAVCEQAARWGERFADFRIAVNVSASAFQGDELVSSIRSALERTGARAEHLELEITEHALISDIGVAIGKLQALREMGIRISLDDFGTGYSSMSYLRRLPLDVIKVDQSFVRDIEKDRNAAAIVKALITMARALDLHLVAEGVETQAQLDFITEQDASAEVQGWVYAPAVSAPIMETYLEQGMLKPVPPEQLRAYDEADSD